LAISLKLALATVLDVRDQPGIGKNRGHDRVHSFLNASKESEHSATKATLALLARAE
jgi:hypothetical protein